eukprot:4042318-Prorocentrum_lima.AAC.1
MVAAGKWSVEDHMMWYAATLEPAWAGERSPPDAQSPPDTEAAPIGAKRVFAEGGRVGHH